jgi:exosortase
MSSLPATETSHEKPGTPAEVGLSGLAVVLLLGALVAVLYWKILSGMVIQWHEDPNYTHGFLVPLFSLYLIWRRRAVLLTLPRTGGQLGLVLVLAGVSLLYVGDLGADNFLMRSSLVVTLAGLVLFHLGDAIFKAVLFPLAFLLFMVPLPGVVFYGITFPLQQLAARQAAWTLETLGVPVFLDGNIIQLAQLSLGVTEACSGIRSLISLVAGAVAWAYLFLPMGWATVLFVSAALPITIAANAARVVLTGLIGQYAGVEYASGFFHEFAGLVIYVCAFACLLGTQSLILAGGRLVGRARS